MRGDVDWLVTGFWALYLAAVAGLATFALLRCF